MEKENHATYFGTFSDSLIFGLGSESPWNFERPSALMIALMLNEPCVIC